jgi:6-phosphofructokinase 1
LTGGGDAPGLNGIIESCAKCLLAAGVEVIGIRDGFEGIFDRRTIEITPALLEGLHSNAGTCLGTSNKSNVAGREEEFVAKYKSLGVEGIIAAGGDGTFASLSRVGADVPILGVPKTIDNDLSGTEITFGYDTACSVVADAVDALRATASAHRRVMVVETMGRTAGWIALGGGLASYSDVILIPERPFDRGALLEHVKKRREKGFEHLMIAVSEGAHAAGEGSVVSFLSPNSPLPERLGGIGERIARWIEKEIGWESRHVVLGHLQSGPDGALRRLGTGGRLPRRTRQARTAFRSDAAGAPGRTGSPLALAREGARHLYLRTELLEGKTMRLKTLAGLLLLGLIGMVLERSVPQKLLSVPEEKPKPVQSIEPPSVEKLHQEVAQKPDEFPKSLLDFNKQISAHIKEAQKDEAKAGEFFPKLEECVMGGERIAISVRALCLQNATRLSRIWPRSLGERGSHLKAAAPANVIGVERDLESDD